MCCLWHVLSKRKSLLSYLSKICMKVRGRDYWKRGRVYCHRGRLLQITKAWGVKSKREKLSIRERLVFKFYCAMTCCIAINAKEGDCWIQLSNCVLFLMLHKCHTSYLLVASKLRWYARWFSMSTEYSWTLPCADSVYRVHSGVEGKCGRNKC